MLSPGFFCLSGSIKFTTLVKFVKKKKNYLDKLNCSLPPPLASAAQYVTSVGQVKDSHPSYATVGK